MSGGEYEPWTQLHFRAAGPQYPYGTLVGVWQHEDGPQEGIVHIEDVGNTLANKLLMDLNGGAFGHFEDHTDTGNTEEEFAKLSELTPMYTDMVRNAPTEEVDTDHHSERQ